LAKSACGSGGGALDGPAFSSALSFVRGVTERRDHLDRQVRGDLDFPLATE